jgi:hypothetical protein
MLSNNSELDRLPDSIANLTCLEFFSTEGSDPNIYIPEKLQEHMYESNGITMVDFPEDMKTHCTGMSGF